MYLTFRQGIARRQTDVFGSQTFLKKSSDGAFIDLIVSPDPTVLIFSHKDSNYIITERKTVKNAWGPFPAQGTKYLYWDLSLLDGSLTRNFSLFEPLYTQGEPANPSLDQHWFDLSTFVMKVWSGVKWIEKIRLFAAKFTSSEVIIPYPVGGHTNITGNFEAGELILDSFNKPLRQSNGTLVTSATKMALVGGASTNFALESAIAFAMAGEFIPKFSLIQLISGKKALLNRPNDPFSRIAGIVLEDLHESETGRMISSGLVRNEQWSFSNAQINRPVFCGPTGQITTTPPSRGVNQIAGFVFDKDTVFISIKQPIILDAVEEENIVIPSAPTGIAPFAEFTVNNATGLAPLSVTFSSTSKFNPTRLEWDFNNDGMVDAIGENASFVYLSPGKYSVRLHALNRFGQHDTVRHEIINVLAPRTGSEQINLGIQLGGPNQVRKSQSFQISVTCNNDTVTPALNVKTVLRFNSTILAGFKLLDLPGGAVETVVGGNTFLTLPEIPLLESGNPKNYNIKIVAPNIKKLEVHAVISSTQKDVTVLDNAVTLTVNIKP